MIAKLKARAAKAGITGNREYNTGWHTALDLDNLLTISEIIALARHRAQGKPRGAFPRRLSGEERRSGRKYNLRITKGPDGKPERRARAGGAR